MHALVLDEVNNGHVVVLGTDVVDHRRVAEGGKIFFYVILILLVQ